MENQANNQINIKDKILTEINSGNVSMRPKLQFTMRFVALVVLASSILILSIFILNFLSFSVRMSHHDSLLGFGLRGILTFLLIFPWMLLALDIALIIMLEWLVRKFEFGYRMPVLYLLGGLFTITIVSGLLVDRGTPLNDNMFKKSQGVSSPFTSFYKHAKIVPAQGSGVCVCKVVSVEKNKIIVEDSRSKDDEEDVLTVFFPENGDFKDVTSTLQAGNTIFLAGDEIDGVVQAFGVRTIQMQAGY